MDIRRKDSNSIDSQLLTLIRDQFIVSITDASGTIIDVNDAFCKISGFERKELLGKNHRIINSGSHEAEFFSVMWKTIQGGNSWQGEICNRTKNGQLYWVDSVITPIKDEHGNIDQLVSIRRDVTARKFQEQELLKHRSLLDQTGEIAGVGGWELNLKSDKLYWSKETYCIHGVELDYVPKLDEAINFYAPEARTEITEAVNKAIETGMGYDLELPFIRATGEHIWVRAVGSAEFENGKATRLIGAFQDITARVQQRQLIEAAHTRMDLATDSGKIGVWEYDLKQNVLRWDDWMYRLYGLSPSNQTEAYELWSKHLHPEDKALAEQAVQDAISGHAKFDIEFRVIWEDGSVHNIRGTAIVERDQHNEPCKMIGVNWDVSNFRKITEELAEQHELLQVTLESIGDAVITTNAQGITEWLNPVAQRMTGWTVDEAKGRPLSQIFHIVNEDTRVRTENPVETCLSQGKIVGLANHTVLISRAGEEFGIEDSAAPIKDKNGDVLGVVLVFHDVTEQRRLSGEVSYQATHDALTGLVNRAEFDARLHRTLNTCHEDQSEHALLYIDLDQFKIINDTCGHTIGDEVLKKVAKVFKGVIRSRDTLARLGGDEFGVILEHCSGDQAQRVAENLCDKMDAFRFLHGSHRFRIGASVGLVAIDHHWSTPATLMQAADTSCFAAKEAGRNRVHVFSDNDRAIRTRHGEMQWTTRIERALDENRFTLYAQRLEEIGTDTYQVHAEVLVRLLDDDNSLVSPGVFFPAAERFQLATRIDKWVLQKTIDWLMALSEHESDSIKFLSVNLSGQSVGDRAFHQFATDLLSSLSADECDKLCFEITETAAITNITDASLFIEQIKSFGSSIALDDFGAGTSSFGYLKSLDVDVLKIDGQFIQDLVTDALDEAAVKCFVDVANVINLQTVAEFVDSPEVYQRVKELGIDFAQGFLLHKPEPIDNLLPQLKSLGSISNKP